MIIITIIIIIITIIIIIIIIIMMTRLSEMLPQHVVVLVESMSVRGIQALEAILGGLDNKSNDAKSILDPLSIARATNDKII